MCTKLVLAFSLLPYPSSEGVVSLSGASQKIASLMATASQNQFTSQTGASAPGTMLVRSFMSPTGQPQFASDTSASTTTIAGVALAAAPPLALVTGQQGVQLLQPVSLGQSVLAQQVPLQSQQHQHQEGLSHAWATAEHGDLKPQAHMVREHPLVILSENPNPSFSTRIK